MVRRIKSRWVIAPVAAGLGVGLLMSTVFASANPGPTAQDQHVFNAPGPALDSAHEGVLRSIELPPRAGNGSEEGVNWKMNTPTDLRGVRSVIEWEAHCDWYIYALLEGGLSPKTRDGTLLGLAQIAGWTSMVENGWGLRAAEIAQKAGAGDLSAMHREFELGNCVDPTGSIQPLQRTYPPELDSNGFPL